ncbi:YtxH domain-containing protein [Chloroflexota bacterium]
MDIGDLRDVMVIILAFLAIGGMVLLLALSFVVFRKINPLLHSTREAFADFKGGSTPSSDGIISRVVRLLRFIVRGRRRSQTKHAEAKKGAPALDSVRDIVGDFHDILSSISNTIVNPLNKLSSLTSKANRRTADQRKSSSEGKAEKGDVSATGQSSTSSAGGGGFLSMSRKIIQGMVGLYTLASRRRSGRRLKPGSARRKGATQVTHEKNGGGFFAGFFMGGMLGAVIGFLFAPQPGDRTRVRLRDKIDDMITQARTAWDESKKADQKTMEDPEEGLEEETQD